MTAGSDLLLLNLRLVGIIMASLVVVNLLVPGRFRWREEMARLSLLNRQILLAHTAFLILMLALLSALLLALPEALLEPTPLARAVLLGLTIFWGLRMLMQWFFYSPTLWRGNRTRTAVHYVFSILWIYVTAVFALALWSLRGA